MQKIKLQSLFFSFTLFLLPLISCGDSNSVKYTYGNISTGSVKKTISVTGVIDVIDSERIVSKVPGLVTKVFFDYNNQVKKGNILALIDSDRLDEAIYRKSMQLEGAKLKLIAAKKDLNAKSNMLKENLISKQGLDDAKLKYKSVAFSYKNIYLDYKNLIDRKKNTKIKAPISGIVLTRNIDSNKNVGVGTLLFVIVPTLAKMRLTISIDESDIGSIKKGQNVLFTVSAFPDATFNGKISQIRFNPIRKGTIITYESIVIVDNSKLQLKPGMTATATVLVAKKKNVTRIKNQAFIVSPVDEQFSDGKKFLWLKGEGKIKNIPVHRVPVQIGLAGDFYTEIKSKVDKDADILVSVIKDEE